MGIKMIIKEHHKQLYVHKSDNLEEVDQFLERPNLPKCTQEIGNLNKTIPVKEIESTINNLPKQKVSDSDDFTCEFY